jgi:multidrug efflux pump subunit AcrB
MITIVVVVMGIIFAMSLNREVFPSISYGYIIIITPYPGSSPEEIEKTVTTPIEEEIADVDGIKHLESVTREGVSTIIIQAESDVDGLKLDQFLNDLKNEVDKVQDLPDDVEDTEFLKISAEFPVITIALGGDVAEDILRDTADRLKDKIELIDGVGSVDLSGYRNKEIVVRVDPRRLEAVNLTLTEVVESIKNRNLNIPAGNIDVGRKELLIRTIGETAGVTDIEEVIIRSLPTGTIRVKDIAAVSEVFEEEEVIGRINGSRSINISITKQEDGDVIDIVDEILFLVDEERVLLPAGAEINLVQDFAKYVKRRQNTLLINGAIGLFLVLLVLYTFLESRVAFWAAMGIPFSFLLAIAIMYYAGITLNLLSMFGLILVLGIVVDDAIVVSENVFRYRERGLSPLEAAVTGAEEVILPVTAAIATNIAAFLPLLIVSGITGKFLRVIPQVVIITLLASLVEAFLILPSHLAEFVKVRVGKAKKEARAWFSHVRDFYGGLLGSFLNRRYVIFFGLLGVAVATIIFGLLTMEFVWMGKVRAEIFQINVYNPVNSNLTETDRVLREVEELVLDLPADEVAAVVTTVGRIELEHGPQFGSYLGQVWVELTEKGYAGRGADAIIDELREGTSRIAGPTSITYEVMTGGPPTGAPVSVDIRGDNFVILETLAEEMMGELGTIRGVKDIDTNFRKGKDELQIIVDEHKARSLGLNVAMVAAELRNAVTGGDAGNIRRGDEKIDIVVKYDEPFQHPEYILNFSVPSISGERIPIKSVADITYSEGIFKIYHSEQERTITVSADIVGGENTSREVNMELIRKFGNASRTHPGYVYDYSGEFEDTQESLESMIKAFWLAVAIIYVILAALFKSFIQPVIILFTLPFSFIGVVLGLFIMGEELSILAVIGIVALTGIVVNDSLVLVDFINRARATGMKAYDAVLESGKTRLRPILLTSLTTIGGLGPMAFGLGGSEPYLAPMAISIVWGLMFATVLTLLIIPTLYLIIDDISTYFTEKFRGGS